MYPIRWLTGPLLVLCGSLITGSIAAAAREEAAVSPRVTKVALVSTQMVLERKFKLMAEAARAQGVELDWTQVDAEGEKGVARVLKNASLVLIDAPRQEDQAMVERLAGAQLRAAKVPGASINVMSPPVRLRTLGLPQPQAQRVFEYYVGGTRVNHERLAQYLKVLVTQGDESSVPPPVPLPNGAFTTPPTRKRCLPTWPATWRGGSSAPGVTRWPSTSLVWKPHPATSPMVKSACWMTA